MWFCVSVPDFADGAPDSGAVARLARVYAAPGARLDRGASLLDLIVDLSGGVVRDCPPVSTCRIIVQEPLWLRSLIADDRPLVPGDVLALLSSDADSPPAPPMRAARTALVAVLAHADWWDEG